MKKGCIIAAAVAVGLVFIAFIGGIFFFAFALTGGVADAGKVFLSEIGSGKIKEAYDSASATLKSQQTAEEFEENVKKLHLTEYASASWGNRQMENDRGLLEGSVFTHSGGEVPLRIELIKESGKWKVLSLKSLQSGVIIEPAAKAFPSDDKLKAMALESLLALNKALKDKNFAAFQEQGSSAFRKEVSPEKLMEAFKGFIDQGIDISSIQNVQPVFDTPPALNPEGLLVLKGSYPTTPRPVVFGLKYGFESGAWRIQAINVDVPPLAKKYPVKPTPSDENLKAMALESLKAFNKAVQEKSFADFHKECATQLREQVSVEKFNEAFKAFMDKGVDISSIEKVDPVFDAPPQVNPDGELALNGSYPGNPVVAFQLKYVFEDDAWKLLAINVNLP